jgi:hypothetical protein
MTMKWLVGLVVGCLLAGWGWFHFVGAGLPGADWPGVTTLKNLPGVSPATSRTAPAANAAGRARKCLVKGEVLYTNGECPTGSHEQPVSGGTVSVMPAGPTTASGQSPHRPSHVRELLVKPDEVSLKDRRMEEVIGK